MRAAIGGAVLISAIFIVVAARAETLHFHARLSGAAEAPPNQSHGVGLAELTLDTDIKLLSWRVTYSGLGGPVTGAHFNAPPEPGATVMSTMDFKQPLASPIISSARLNDIQIGDLRAGLWSVNLLTTRSPRGEIRGDLEQGP